MMYGQRRGTSMCAASSFTCASLFHRAHYKIVIDADGAIFHDYRRASG